jgi:hypothetical protein
MPFIYKRIWGNYSKLTYTRLLRCNHCGFLFYEERFTDGEAEKYYNGYWQEEYHKERSKIEWWFTDKFYKERNKDIIYMKSKDLRNKKISEILKPYIGDIVTVLDYGGNDGGYKPKSVLQENYYIYDINNKQIDLKNKLYDLVILNCVLEHLSYPLGILTQLKFKYMYIEVPCSLSLVLSLGVKRSLRQYIIDIYKILKYRSFFHMHEHLQYYSEKSLKILAEKLNCKILFFEKTDIMYKMLIKKK